MASSAKRTRVEIIHPREVLARIVNDDTTEGMGSGEERKKETLTLVSRPVLVKGWYKSRKV